ncbi:MAG: family 43 glycosylhydrolase [Puniceicoccaceae bacterium]
MKYPITFLLLTLLLASACTPGTPDSRLAQIEAHDKAVYIHDHWIRDPYIYLHSDGYYYLTGTTLKTGPDEIVGIYAWKSRDLVEWEMLPRLWRFADSSWMLDHMLATGSEHIERNGPLVWAPELYFIDGRWVITHTSNGRAANLMVNDSIELEPPFIEPMAGEFGRRHDPAFFLEDGVTWLVWGCTRIAPLKPDFSGFAGEEVAIGPSNRKMGHEGAYIRKIGGKYVLFGTAWSTDTMRHGTYNLYYCTSDSLTGPYSERRFAGRFLGHGTPFQDKAGRWWCTAFYNANEDTISDDQSGDAFSDTAYTVNKQGTTIVPLDIQFVDGDVFIRAKDARYASPGGEEVQQFPELD